MFPRVLKNRNKCSPWCLTLPCAPVIFPCYFPLSFSPVFFPCHFPLSLSPVPFPCRFPLSFSPIIFPCPFPLPLSPVIFPCHFPLSLSPAPFSCHFPLPLFAFSVKQPQRTVQEKQYKQQGGNPYGVVQSKTFGAPAVSGNSGSSFSEFGKLVKPWLRMQFQIQPLPVGWP
jgi:hypothetical protein